MNAWDNIKMAQIVHDLIHQVKSSETITDFNLSYIYYARDNKPKIRNYRNFLIYLTNHYRLTDITDETNLTFEKFLRKIEILIQKNKEDDNRNIAKSARKNTEEIFKTVRFSKTLRTSLKDTASILIGVAFETGVFENANNIEIIYQLVYQKVIRDGNYLELSKEETVTQLLSYIEKIPYLKPSSKEKGKETGDII